MEELIKQAFLHVEVIGPHVQEGHYDLIGPNGEIILPSVWEKVVEPDWAITMHMWPMDKAPLRQHMPPNMQPGGMPRPQHPGQHPQHPQHPQRPPPGMISGFMRPPSTRPGGGGIPPPPPNIWQGGMPGGMPMGMQGRPGGIPAGARIVQPSMEPQIVTVDPNKPPRRKDKGAPSSMLGWMAGSKPKSSSKKYVILGPNPVPPKHKHEHRPSAPSQQCTSYFLYPAQIWPSKSVAFPC
jgi:hypothetical protein